MLEMLIYLSVVFMGFFSIMNPVSGVSVFLTLTLHDDEASTKSIAFQSTLTAFLIVLCFCVAGNFLLNIFGISFTALRLTGGILISIIGYKMLQGETSYVNEPTKNTLDKVIKEEGSIAITPLGIPLLAGPGVIITAMNFSAGTLSHLFITIFAFLLLCIITYYTFIFGKKIQEFMGVSALKVVTRMMGLVLAVIGVQMLTEGIYSSIREFNPYKYF